MSLLYILVGNFINNMKNMVNMFFILLYFIKMKSDCILYLVFIVVYYCFIRFYIFVDGWSKCLYV